MNLFTGAQIQRQAWGASMRYDSPGRNVSRPGWIHRVEEVAIGEGEGLAIRVEHGQQDLRGCRLLVEMTPATKSPRNKPLERWLTKAGATDLGSYFALQPTGGQYLLPEPRYQVAPGQRFAVRVTIIDEDGIRGRPRMVDLIRTDFAAPTTSQFRDREEADAAPRSVEHAPVSLLAQHPQAMLISCDAVRASEIRTSEVRKGTKFKSAAVVMIDDKQPMTRGRSPTAP